MQQCSMALRCFPECKINAARKQEREKWKETGFPAIIPAIKRFISLSLNPKDKLWQAGHSLLTKALFLH